MTVLVHEHDLLVVVERDDGHGTGVFDDLADGHDAVAHEHVVLAERHHPAVIDGSGGDDGIAGFAHQVTAAGRLATPLAARSVSARAPSSGISTGSRSAAL